MADDEKLEGLLDARYRPSFRLLIGIGVTIIGVAFLINQAEAFVESRIDKRILAGSTIVEMQTQRLEKVEARVDEVRQTVVEIRADVRAMRSEVEAARRGR